MENLTHLKLAIVDYVSKVLGQKLKYSSTKAVSILKKAQDRPTDSTSLNLNVS